MDITVPIARWLDKWEAMPDWIKWVMAIAVVDGAMIFLAALTGGQLR